MFCLTRRGKKWGGYEHRRRLKTEEVAKVVAIVRGTYFNAALTI